MTKSEIIKDIYSLDPDKLIFIPWIRTMMAKTVLALSIHDKINFEEIEYSDRSESVYLLVTYDDYLLKIRFSMHRNSKLDSSYIFVTNTFGRALITNRKFDSNDDTHIFACHKPKWFDEVLSTIENKLNNPC